MFWLFFLHLLPFSALRHCQHAITAFPLEDDSDRPGDSKIDKESNGWIIFSCMLAVLRVLLNLTHENGRLKPTPFFSFLFFLLLLLSSSSSLASLNIYYILSVNYSCTCIFGFIWFYKDKNIAFEIKGIKT